MELLFSRLISNSPMGLRPFIGILRIMLPQEIFKIMILKSDKNEFHVTKFLDFLNFVTNSLTFRGLFKIPRLFQVFKISGHCSNRSSWGFS